MNGDRTQCFDLREPVEVLVDFPDHYGSVSPIVVVVSICQVFQLMKSLDKAGQQDWEQQLLVDIW